MILVIRRLILVAPLLLSAPLSSASGPLVNVEWDIIASDLAVVGQLTDTERVMPDSGNLDRRALSVERPLFGDVSKGDTLTLQVIHSDTGIPGVRRSMIPDDGAWDGERCLWLLRCEPDGSVRPSTRDWCVWRLDTRAQLLLDALRGWPGIHTGRSRPPRGHEDIWKVDAVSAYLEDFMAGREGIAPADG